MAFIVFEGMDGSGKSTQARMFYEKLKKEGYACHLTQEPGGTAIGQKIRQLLLDPENKEMFPETELFLYMASRSQLVSEVIKPKIAEGCIVISDRFLLSSIVYQGIVGGVGKEKVQLLGGVATQGISPDKIFLLNVNFEQGMARLPRQRQLWDRVELKGEQYHRQIQQAYLEAVKEQEKAIILDGSLPAEEIHLQIMEAMKDVLSLYSRP